MWCGFPDENFATPVGPLGTDKDVQGILDVFLRKREFEKRHRHPDVEVIYSFEALPRRNLEIYYYHILRSAMARRCPRIIVEPSDVGVRIGQYINLGYYMHVACVGSGLFAICTGLTFRHKIYYIYTSSLISCTLLHASNLYYRYFQYSGYQFMDSDDVDEFLKEIIPEITLSSDCPIVLIPYNAFRRRVWHHVVGCAAGIMMISLIYRGLPVLLCRCPDGTVPRTIRHEGNLFEFFSVFPIICISSASAAVSKLNSSPTSLFHSPPDPDHHHPRHNPKLKVKFKVKVGQSQSQRGRGQLNLGAQISSIFTFISQTLATLGVCTDST